MTDELVSIIVAVYNNREDLDRCVQSILNQTYTNIELILVSDKPTDGSEEICRKYAASDKRVKLIIHEENQGVACAWRDGVRAASGKHVGIIDADDYIEADLYEKLMACKADFDLVITHWWREEPNRTSERQEILAQGSYTTEEDMNFLIDHALGFFAVGGRECIQPGLYGHPGPKLYKTAILQRVLSDIQEAVPLSIDVAMTCLYILKCKSVLLTDICGIHIQVRTNSNTHATTIDRSTSNIRELYHALAPHFMAHPRSNMLMQQLQRRIAGLLNRAPVRMGFLPEAQNKTLVFPFINRLDNQRIILCGAGMVGQDYWRQIHRLHMCDIELWVDKRWEYRRREGLAVSPPEELMQRQYDYVVIAVFHQELAEEIKKDLLLLGVDEEKILWKAPFVY